MSFQETAETESLLPPPPPVTQTDLDAEDEEIQRFIATKEKEERRGDVIALIITIGSLLAITVFTWSMILTSDPSQFPLFAVHPPAQTLAILIFAIGIITLQPTRSRPSKARGLTRHQIIQLALGTPVIAIGAIVMIWNKQSHGADHFTSWHGKFGLIAVIWIVLHILGGGMSVWFKGRAFGGEDEGKVFWKWHRLSGYLLFPFLLLTIHLAGAHADWVGQHTTSTGRLWIYTILPVLALAGIIARVRWEKLPGFRA